MWIKRGLKHDTFWLADLIMAYATYQKQRVIEVASAKAHHYREEIAAYHRNENEKEERMIEDQMRSRWWRAARSREKAAQIVRHQMSEARLFMWPSHWLFYDNARRAERILQTAETTDGNTVTLTDEDVEFLFS